MKKSKLNIDNKTPLSKAFPQSLDINPTPEQLEQMYKNMCEYFGLSYNAPKELDGVKQICKELKYK